MIFSGTPVQLNETNFDFSSVSTPSLPLEMLVSPLSSSKKNSRYETVVSPCVLRFIICRVMCVCTIYLELVDLDFYACATSLNFFSMLWY